jgi:hypothetical protein
MICFNGDGMEDLDHESFYFSPNASKREKEFSFCKTARKPYDLAVCATLIALKVRIPGFSYTSDGDAEEWKPAKAFVRKHLKI